MPLNCADEELTLGGRKPAKEVSRDLGFLLMYMKAMEPELVRVGVVAM
jgi:hypothetical protein